MREGNKKKWNDRRRPVTRGATFLIITEGKKTEYNYFYELGIFCRLGNITVWHPKCTDPLNLTKTAIEAQKRRLPFYDEVWVVCDTEGPSHEYRRKLKEAKNVKGANKIKFAPSSPSFEFWLLLHFCYTTKSFTSGDEVAKHLNNAK